MSGVGRLWVYLSASPLLWLAATLIVYQAGARLFARAGNNPFLNPVAVAVAGLIAALRLTGTSYAVFFEGAKYIHFLLGVATVALAVPLYENRKVVRRALAPMAAALVAGSATAVVSAVGIARLAGASPETVISIAPKSATTPIAMAIAEQLGGIPSLTTALVVLTGVTGAVMATPLLNALRARDFRARGFAAGVAAHGLGVARAFQVSEVAGIFAGIALALNGLATAVLAPLLMHLFR